MLHDGDTVKLGDATLVAHLTPGHTRGCTTWTMTVQEGGRSYNVMIIGSLGVNPGFRLVNNAEVPQIADEFTRAFKVSRSLPCDVPLGSHPGMYNMAEKYAKVGKGPNPYIDPAGCKAELDLVEGVFRSAPGATERTEVGQKAKGRGGAMQMTKRSLWAAAFCLSLAAMPARAGAQSKADVDGGKLLFQGMCAECHGAGGAGGDAPPPEPPEAPARADGCRARQHPPLHSNGIPNTAMPRVRRLSESETRQLVAYIRSIGKLADAKVPGDAKKGADMYRSLGCASCHIVGGQGGNLGPDLTDIGFMRGPAYLRQAIVDPGAALPKGVLQIPSRGYAEYLPLRIVTKQGGEVRGIRVNEDTFSIQVRDQAGKFYSLRKSDLELLEKQTGKSLMPSFSTRLTPAELTDSRGLSGQPAG